VRDDAERDNALERDASWAQNEDDQAQSTVRRNYAIVAVHWATNDNQAGADQTSTRTWRQELPRWLATLNSHRTRREYEKAVLYFFLAPGVPEVLADLTFDLLLAYRGSLALRAEYQRSTAFSGSTAGRPVPLAPLTPGKDPRLPSGADPGTGPADEATDAADGDPAASGERHQDRSATGPLAPATVNVRLTALRQFLAHCSLWGLLPQLAPERVHAALRRLRIERRRPYQILAEPEWAPFLEAARAPAVPPPVPPPVAARPMGRDTSPPDVPAQDAALHSAQDQFPLASAASSSFASSAGDLPPLGASEPGGGPIALWGVPRSVRRRLAAAQLTADDRHQSPVDNVAALAGERASAAARAGTQLPPPVRSRAGLTGARTAQRDHALLALALATGLRAIELCALDLADVTREWHAGREEWWLVLPDAKTKGQHGGRTLPLAPALVQTLFDYVRNTSRQWERAADRATPLFLSRRRAQPGQDRAHSLPADRLRLSTEQVRRIVDRVETQWIATGALSSAGQDQDVAGPGEGRAISPHALRHSTAVALLQGNERSGRPPASVEHVRGWLGHFDIRTTQGYLAHLDARRARRPFALHPAEEAAPSAGNSGAAPTPQTGEE
jgi:integrase